MSCHHHLTVIFHCLNVNKFDLLKEVCNTKKKGKKPHI